MAASVVLIPPSTQEVFTEHLPCSQQGARHPGSRRWDKSVRGGTAFLRSSGRCHRSCPKGSGQARVGRHWRGKGTQGCGSEGWRGARGQDGRPHPQHSRLCPAKGGEPRGVGLQARLWVGGYVRQSGGWRLEAGGGVHSWFSGLAQPRPASVETQSTCWKDSQLMCMQEGAV